MADPAYADTAAAAARKLARGSDEEQLDPGQSRAVRLLRRVVPVREEYAGQRFLVRDAGRWVATPLLVVLVAVEAADLVFAVDSIPAVLAISDDTFIVYTSNAFAILGLRALYFLLDGALARFHLLDKGLAVVLGFIGVKMLLTDVVHIPTGISLAVIGGVLAVTMTLSLLRPPPQGADPAEVAAAEPERAHR